MTTGSKLHPSLHHTRPGNRWKKNVNGRMLETTILETRILFNNNKFWFVLRSCLHLYLQLL